MPKGRVHLMRPDAVRTRPDASVRTRPIWRVRLPKRCKGSAPQPPNRPVVVQRPTPCNFSTVCSGLGGLCGLCGAKAHTAGQLSPIFVDLGNLWTWGTFGLGELLEVTLGHFSPPPCAKPVAGRTRPAATPFFASGRVRTRPDASGVRCGAKAHTVRVVRWCKGTHRGALSDFVRPDASI